MEEEWNSKASSFSAIFPTEDSDGAMHDAKAVTATAKRMVDTAALDDVNLRMRNQSVAAEDARFTGYRRKR